MVNVKIEKSALRHKLLHRNLPNFSLKFEIFKNFGVISDLPDDVILLYVGDSNDYLVFPSLDSAISFVHLNYHF